MGADLPHTLYKSIRKDGKKATQADVDEATARMMEAYAAKMKAREEKRKETAPTVDEVFGGALED